MHRISVPTVPSTLDLFHFDFFSFSVTMGYSLDVYTKVGFLFSLAELRKSKKVQDIADKTESNGEIGRKLKECLSDAIEELRDFTQEAKDEFLENFTCFHKRDFFEYEEPDSDSDDDESTFFIGMRLPHFDHEAWGRGTVFTTYRAMPLTSLHKQCEKQAEHVKKILEKIIPEINPSRPVFLTEANGG
jgi:hypothetical protein